jgi:hypothetical protein
MIMDSISMCSNTLFMSNVYVGSSLIWLSVGGLGQDLRDFQMVPIPILSVLTFSTSSPRDILKVKKIAHNLPVGQVKCDVVFLVGLLPGF